MTIDERIEKLTERHEALAQSVELLAAQAETTNQTAKVLLEIVRSHETLIARIEEQS